MVKVEKGRAGRDELAAVALVVLARITARGSEDDAAGRSVKTGPWRRRLEPATGYRAPHSWH